VSFAEHTAPTLINNVDGKPAFSKGELTIDETTGRVERAELRVRLGNIDATMTTTYRADPKLMMWVPARFEELLRRAAAAATAHHGAGRLHRLHAIRRGSAHQDATDIAGAPSVTPRVAIGAACIALTLAAPAAQERRKIDTSPKAVVAAATAYVSTYQKDLAFVLADELATQRVLTPSRGREWTTGALAPNSFSPTCLPKARGSRCGM